jgi:hypothetical protein
MLDPARLHINNGLTVRKRLLTAVWHRDLQGRRSCLIP